ncbi:DNA binding protein, putative [Plasmodium sp. gorilla clade G2]|uniref:DNA binding protein, putative n=1 Tax=Plasmodium sp. gorilla clade G2 TaxID=880535 RepID=UPI000D20262D|nr:DNA binding protein, putative [Plasmodium sp. gorilla clade G2]SOV10213.1 DNA binding protein, putative [Plasmodium sp. gorilla clade G2]
MLKQFKHILNTSHVHSFDFSFGTRFLKSCFSSLRTYENNTYEPLNTLKFPGLVIYVNKDNIEKYEENILKYLKTNVIGFDTEFIIDINEKENNNENRLISSYIENGKDNNYINSQLINIFNKKKKKKKNYAYNLSNNEENKKILCLIQLCSSDLCFVFNIHKLNGHIPISVKNILENEEIIKVAHDIKNEKDMFISNNIQIKNVFDLYNYAIDNFIYPPSLQFLVKIYLKKFLDKKFRLSNWLNYDLLQEQILYAAIDAYASRQIYFYLDQNKKNSKSYILNYIIQEELTKSSHQECNTYNTCKNNDLNNQYIIKREEKIKNMESINNTIHNEKNIYISNQHQNEYDLNRKQLQSYSKHINLNNKNYGFLEKYKVQLINNLKNEIHNKCKNMTNLSFIEEMTFSNNTYKNILSLKHNQNNYNLIKCSSINYDEEINACNQILTYLNQMFSP